MNMVPCHTSIHFDRVILITENLFEIWTLGCSNDCHPKYEFIGGSRTQGCHLWSRKVFECFGPLFSLRHLWLHVKLQFWSTFKLVDFAFSVQMVRSECKSRPKVHIRAIWKWIKKSNSKLPSRNDKYPREIVDHNFSGPKIRPPRIRFRKDPWTGSLGFTMATKQ